MNTPPEPPPFLPFTFGAPASPADAFSSPHPPFTAPRPLITGEELEQHLQSPDAWRSLPGGIPLLLTAAGMEYMLDDFGGFEPNDLRSAHRLLYFASRTPAQMEALWVPPVPRGDAPAPEPMALNIRALCARIGAWAADTFAPCAADPVLQLAFHLWMNVVERMPVSGEKKNPPPPDAPAQTPSPDSASPSSGKCAGSSPEAMPSAPASSTLAPTSASCLMPSSAGRASTETGSLPIPSAPAASPPPAR